MRFASIGSGSSGNGWLVEHGTTRLLVDCGFTLAETRARLARLGLEPDDLTAVLVTHEHGDHLRGVGALARRHRLPVWMTHGTHRAGRAGRLDALQLFDAHRAFTVGDLQVEPFPVPHDANEPCQFVIGDGARRLGLLTDVGSITPHIERMLDGCDALGLETNHDSAMLANGPYPLRLQRRIGGDHGHLSNAQSAALLARLDTHRLQHLVAAHLSEANNEPQRARAALAGALGCAPAEVDVANQSEGIGWRELA